MGFDKICRGSLIGEAHNKGLYVAPELSHARRGTHVSSRSYKLETTATSDNPREIEPTQTFKTQNWFRHDASEEKNHSDDVRPNTQFSPRYWQHASSLAAAPAPRRTEFRSSKNKNTRHEANRHLARDIKPEADHPNGESSVCITSSKAMPREDESATQWREMAQQEDNSKPNPTFNNSVNWMSFSSPREKLVWAKTAKEKWRLEFLKQKHASNSLKTTEQETITKELTTIHNSVDNMASKGKKSFPSLQSEAALLLQQDPGQPLERKSGRRHQFTYDPEPRSSKKGSQPPSSYQVGHGIGGEESFQDASAMHDPKQAEYYLHQNTPAPDADVRPGHRTSTEVQDAMIWGNGTIEKEPKNTESKFVVGGEIRLSGCGKRASRSCLDHSKFNMTNIAAAGVSPRQTRDHRNSDVLRAHLSMPKLDYNRHFSKGAVMNNSFSFGGSGSGIPLGLSKNCSYLESSLVQQCKNRGFGVFSPLQVLNTPVLF